MRFPPLKRRKPFFHDTGISRKHFKSADRKRTLFLVFLCFGIDKRVFSVYNNGCKAFCFTAQLWAKTRQTGACSPAGGCFYMDNLRDTIPFLLDIYGALLTDRQRDVLDLYYNDDLSLSEISENLGITRQGVRDAIRRGSDELLLLEQRLALREKFAVIRSEAEKILRMTDDNAVAECAKRILMTED